MKHNLHIFGHRGAKGLAPENTIEAIEVGIKFAVHGIEVDYQPCLDADVIFHDRIVFKDGVEVAIATIGLAELQKLSGTARIPTLDQILPYTRNCIVNLELKCDALSNAAIARIENFLAGSPLCEQNLLLSSFNLPLLLKCKQYFPNVKRAPLFYGIPLEIEKIIDLISPSALHFSKDFLSREIFQIVADRKLDLNIYTANSPIEAQQLAALGVTGIFTDYPDRFLQALSARY